MKKSSKSQLKSKTPKEYEELGRSIEAILQSEFLERRQAYKASFIKGILSGAGGIIGATLLIALILWLLSIFKQVPLIGPFVDNVRHTVQTSRR